MRNSLSTDVDVQRECSRWYKTSVQEAQQTGFQPWASTCAFVNILCFASIMYLKVHTSRDECIFMWNSLSTDVDVRRECSRWHRTTVQEAQQMGFQPWASTCAFVNIPYNTRPYGSEMTEILNCLR
jgi:hypothetical protein